METIKETSMPDRLLLTIVEAANQLSMGRTSLYTLVMRGDIESVTIGRSRRITRQALDAYVARLVAEQVANGS
jgi:excisionase family DNA binding protein